MIPEKTETRQSHLFLAPLIDQLDNRHPLQRLGAVIDWEKLENELGILFTQQKGHPPKPIRLMVGLLKI